MSIDVATQNSITNALGTVLGYIGAEAATTSTFTRLLWPQRTYCRCSIRQIPKLALLLPTGGPVYKAALQALDSASKNGLFKGKHQGRMLGSPFFPDSGCTYTLHSSDSLWPSHKDACRNNIWLQVVSLLPIPKVFATQNDIEKASATASPLRARVAVRHLTLTVRSISKKSPPNGSINASHEHDGFVWRSILGALASELSGVCIAIVVLTLWRSWSAVLWLLPMMLKVISIATMLKREPLDLSSPELVSAKPQIFEIHAPAELGVFLVITGPPALVLQFFRHYGHPERDRVKELIQLANVTMCGSLFPIGLLCCVAWLPVQLQYVWLSYQMYAVTAMYLTRFLRVETWASTEEAIAASLAKSKKKNPASLWVDMAHGRSVEAFVETSYFTRHSAGAAHVQRLIGHNKVAVKEQSDT